MDTLILNKDGSPLSVVPLSVVSWQDSMRLIVLNKVRVLKEYDNWVIHSQKLNVKVPSIVICTDYSRWTRKVKYCRANIYLRDDFTCQLQNTQQCKDSAGKARLEDLTLDHVIPRSKGGKTTWHNVVTSCKTCNSHKGNNASIVPKQLPHKPTYYEIFAKRKKHPVRVRDPEWAVYLGEWDQSLVQVVTTSNQNHGDYKDG